MTEEEQRRVNYIKQKIWDERDKQRTKVDGPRKDWMDLFIDYILDCDDRRKAKKKKLEEQKEALKNGFCGNPLNSEDVLKYEELIGGKVASSYEEADGTCVRVYEDGNVVRIHYTLTSLFPNIEMQDKCLDQWQKEELSSYLHMSSSEVSKLDWSAIDDLVLERSRNDGPIKQLKYKWVERTERGNV